MVVLEGRNQQGSPPVDTEEEHLAGTYFAEVVD